LKGKVKWTILIFYKSAYNFVPFGAIITDKNHTIIYVNPQAEKIIGVNVLYCHLQKSQGQVKRALDFLKKKDYLLKGRWKTG